MKALKILSILLLGIILLPPWVSAQGSGSLEGSIQRENGSGIGGVSVVVNELGLAEVTDSQGRFSFQGVAAGTYSLSVSLGDYQASRDVTVVSGATATVNETVDWTVSFAETITVVSASRRVERIVEAPAAVTLVTEEEIERQASHGQLPKLLEFTPGAEVTQSGLYDYNFNTRGFNSSLTRRVAVLIDGRDPSVPFLGSQEWAAFTFPLDDIASLEVVRGPSAALYGANASSGIVNLVTKQPRYSHGGVLRLAGGEVSTFNGDFRYAGELGGGWYGKFLAGARTSGDFTQSRNGRAEYSVPCGGGISTDCLPQEAVPLDPEDDAEIFFGSLRFDKYFENGSALTLEGGQSDVSGPVFQTGIGRVQIVELDRPWARANYSTQHWNVLGFYNARDASEQTAMTTGNNIVLDTNNWQFEVQTNWDFANGKARIVAGATYGEEEIDTLDTRTGRQTLVFEPVDSDSSAAFAQLDWSISDRFKLVLAGRFDDSSLHDSQFSPKGSLVYSINSDNTLRFTYNEAFQVANYSEFFLQAQVGAFPGAVLQGLVCSPFGLDCGLPAAIPVLALGNKDLELEEVTAFEVGYSGIINGKSFLTIDYYNTENENFITDLIPQVGTAVGTTNPNFAPIAGLPPAIVAGLNAVVGAAVPGALLSNNLDGSPIIAAVSYTNFGDVDTQGVDIGLNHYFNNEWSLSLGYSWFDFDIKEDLPGFEQLLVPNTPESKFTIGLNYVGSSWDAGISARWVDDFRWAVGPFQGDVESYTTVDLNANFSLNDHIALGVNVANLTDDEHWESFGGDIVGRRALGNVTFSW